MTMEPVETFEHAGRTVRIIPDPEPMSPDEWDTAGHIVTREMPRAGAIADEARDPYARAFADTDRGWEAEGRAIRRAGGVAFPLHVFEDWAPRIGTGAGPEDWNRADGLAYMLPAEMAAERMDADQARAYLRARVSEWDQYHAGDVYGFEILDAEGNYLDSCWGHYGIEWAREAAREAAEGNPAPTDAQRAALLLGMATTR